MVKEPLVYVDGRFVEKSKATVSVFDHGLLYGDGIFEGIRAYNGSVFRLVDHIDRLYDSAKSIRLTMPLTKREMSQESLDFRGSEHVWGGPPLGALANEFNRIAIE